MKWRARPTAGSMDVLQHTILTRRRTHGSPRWIIAMDRLCVNQHAASHQTAGHGPGAVELRDRLHALLRPAGASNLPGLAAHHEGRQRRAALVRMVSGR